MRILAVPKVVGMTEAGWTWPYSSSPPITLWTLRPVRGTPSTRIHPLGTRRSARSSGPGARRGHRRSGSDSVLAARRNLEQGGAESLENGPEGGPGPGTTEAQAEAASMAPDEGWGPAASCAGGRGQEGGLAQAADSAAAPLAGGREGGAGVRAHHAQTPGTEALEGCSGKHASAFAASQAATPAPGQPRGSTGAPAHPPSGVGGAMKRQVSHDDGVASVQYRLQAVGHSLGGCSLLIYAVHRAMAGRAHHLKRLVLLSPAGYHSHYPRVKGRGHGGLAVRDKHASHLACCTKGMGTKTHTDW